jgi:hypothetical protein
MRFLRFFIPAILTLSFISTLWAAPPSPTPGTLIIANQATTRVIVAPYTNSTANAGTLLFPFADGITFVGTGSGRTLFTGSIDIVLQRSGGTLIDTIGCSDTQAGYTRPAPSVATSGTSPLVYTLTFPNFTNAAVQTILQRIFYKCSGNSTNAQNRTLWIFVKETNAAGNAPTANALSIGSEYHYYTYNPGLNYWNEALFNAGNAPDNPYYYGLRGYLATLTSAAEIDKIIDNLSDSPTGVWVSGSDAGNEGIWTWRSGPESQAANGGTFPTVNTNPGGFDYSYANWHAGEPNNSLGQEHYLALQTNKEWNDLRGLLGQTSPSTLPYYVEYGGYYTGASAITAGNLNYVNIRVLSPNSLAPAAGF